MVKFDSTESGLRKTLKEYEEIALRFVWSVGEEGATSGQVWAHVNEQLAEKGESRSRAAVLFFLDRMVEWGVLGYKMTTGKGGKYRIYIPKLDERGYRKFMLRVVIESMMRDFPEETREVLDTYEFG